MCNIQYVYRINPDLCTPRELKEQRKLYSISLLGRYHRKENRNIENRALVSYDRFQVNIQTTRFRLLQHRTDFGNSDCDTVLINSEKTCCSKREATFINV